MKLILIIFAIIVVTFVFFLRHKFSYKKLLITILCIVSLVFVCFQHRHFYKVNNITFTVWKTQNGCYITPYKYIGLSFPDKDYINISNVGSLTIFVNDNSTLLIFYNRGDDGIGYINCNLKSFNYQEFLPSGYEKSNDGTISSREIKNYFEEDSILKAKRKQCIDFLPFIDIDARTMSNYVKDTE